jgi:Na+/H+ antiporter NhaA
VGLALGFRLPYHATWRHLAVLAGVSTMGFTMALFFATVAVGPGPVLSEIKMGALITVFGGALALLTARGLRLGRFAAPGAGN